MNGQRAIRLLVAGDQAVVREGIAAILNQQPDMCVVAEAANAAEALERCVLHRPNIILMDLQWSDGHGVSTIGSIRREAAHARIVVLTDHKGDEDIYQAIKAGAKAYLLKSIAPADLLQAIRDVHAGGTVISPNVAAILADRIRYQALTKREREVLTLITKGLTNQEIGCSLFITEGTVKAHVRRIFSKLQVSDRTQATMVGIKRGLVRAT